MKIYGFDTEATPFNHFESPQLILWVCNNDEEFFFGETTQSFLEFVLSLRESSVIISFNLSFDWYIAFKQLDLTKYFDRIDINVDGVPPYRTVLSRKIDQKTRVSIVFLDLANFVGRHKLEKLALDWEVQPKLDSGTTWEFCFEDHLQTPWESLLMYCLNDADIVYRIYRDNFFLLIKEEVLNLLCRVLRSSSLKNSVAGNLLHALIGLKIGNESAILEQLFGYVWIPANKPTEPKSMILIVHTHGLCEGSKCLSNSKKLSKGYQTLQFTNGLKG